MPYERLFRSSYLQKRCTRNHPPGRKVYQRGAHAIWEVDCAKDKVKIFPLSLIAGIHSTRFTVSCSVRTYRYLANFLSM
jgi:hypothetical protein